MKCDGTRSETRFRLSAKRTSPFKSAGATVQLTTGSRGVRISGSNAGYTMFRGSVKGTGYPYHSPFSPSLPLPRVTVCHHVSTGLYHSRVCVLLMASSQNPCFNISKVSENVFPNLKQNIIQTCCLGKSLILNRRKIRRASKTRVHSN